MVRQRSELGHCPPSQHWQVALPAGYGATGSLAESTGVKALRLGMLRSRRVTPRKPRRPAVKQITNNYCSYERERERETSLAFCAILSHSPSKVAKEWRNIPLLFSLSLSLSLSPSLSLSLSLTNSLALALSNAKQNHIQI